MKRITIIAAAALAISAVAGPAGAGELHDRGKRQIEELVTKLVNERLLFLESAVVVFDGVDCPDGWERYQPAAGRFLLGFDEEDRRDNRRVLSLGGAETHRLTAQETPSHSHGQVSHPRRCDGDCGALVEVRQVETPPEAVEAHNNMPPYLVLNFCHRP